MSHDGVHRGDRLSDHEVAFTLLMQNARELAQFNADRVLSQRLAVEAGGEPSPAPRPTTDVEQVIVPQPTTKNTAPEAPIWGEWLVSLLWMLVLGSPTASP
ncbi:hypothetical protein K503DRAFT_805187 [Rhizopogon vinicolor AM-OR11-026]|uniref:Uncharacterized protein n=1 Tax=Rhizopogon vinicolor AM-OR11-026 TaxID=1314800 RepID=A0A1B7MIR6_9AGAM|nr:hypothetical protein K503DRAFT_805187 [Rhizopogon vinicolor AM-OR11-026]